MGTRVYPASPTIARDHYDLSSTGPSAGHITPPGGVSRPSSGEAGTYYSVGIHAHGARAAVTTLTTNRCRTSGAPHAPVLSLHGHSAQAAPRSRPTPSPASYFGDLRARALGSRRGLSGGHAPPASNTRGWGVVTTPRPRTGVLDTHFSVESSYAPAFDNVEPGDPARRPGRSGRFSSPGLHWLQEGRPDRGATAAPASSARGQLCALHAFALVGQIVSPIRGTYLDVRLTKNTRRTPRRFAPYGGPRTTVLWDMSGMETHYTASDIPDTGCALAFATGWRNYQRYLAGGRRHMAPPASGATHVSTIGSARPFLWCLMARPPSTTFGHHLRAPPPGTSVTREATTRSLHPRPGGHTAPSCRFAPFTCAPQGQARGTPRRKSDPLAALGSPPGTWAAFRSSGVRNTRDDYVHTTLSPWRANGTPIRVARLGVASRKLRRARPGVSRPSSGCTPQFPGTFAAWRRTTPQ